MSKTLTPKVAVDTVLFTIEDETLKVLLVQIQSDIYKDKWALPGGLVKMEETLDQSAVRVLSEKTNLKDIYLEQLYTFGDIKRDLRGRSISVAYFALIPDASNLDIQTEKHYKNVGWFPVNKLPKLAFDHEQIVGYAHKRLKDKLHYTNIAFSLLPKKFTLTQMQKIYEIILNQKIDKRNFRRKILSLNIIKSTKSRLSGLRQRPAELFEFKNSELEFLS